MTSQGSAYARFRRACANGNVTIVRAEAAELDQIGLADAAMILLVILRSEPETYQRAAIRWLAKLCQEARDVDLVSVAQAATALESLPRETGARPTLAELCKEAGEWQAARVF